MIKDGRALKHQYDAKRQARFRKGFKDGVAGKKYTINNRTWQNMGWSIGQLLGERSDGAIDAIYMALLMK